MRYSLGCYYTPYDQNMSCERFAHWMITDKLHHYRCNMSFDYGKTTPLEIGRKGWVKSNKLQVLDYNLSTRNGK